MFIGMLALLFFLSIFRMTSQLTITDIEIPEICETFAKHTDHLLLEYSITFKGEIPMKVVKSPDSHYHMILDASHDFLMIKGLCLNGTREITWKNAKQLQLQPFITHKLDEDLVHLPLILSISLRHITETRDFEIFDAYKIRNISKILELIDSHVGINAVDENGFTMLMHAAQIGYIPIVAALLNTRRPTVNINIAKSNGFTALFYAVADKSEGVLLALLRRGADPNAILLQEDTKGSTPLHMACALEKPLHAELLLKYGANPFTKNVYNMKPLQMLTADASYSIKLQFNRLFEVNP